MRSSLETLQSVYLRTPDVIASPETQIDEIIYTGTSPKRGAVLSLLARQQGKTLIRIPGGPENNNLDPVQIAGAKIDHVTSVLKEQGRIFPDSKVKRVLVGADVQVHSPILGPDGKTVSKSRGKPEEMGDVMNVFQGMRNSALATGDKRYYGYMIEAGSESRTMVGNQVLRIESATNFYFVALQRQAVDYLATPEGTEEYLNLLKTFLRSPIYTSNGISQSSSPTQICGGLDLSVLNKFGAIRKINQTHAEDTHFEEELESATFAAYVGFDSSVLEQIHPKAKQIVKPWPWVKAIVDYARGNPLQPYLM